MNLFLANLSFIEWSLWTFSKYTFFQRWKSRFLQRFRSPVRLNLRFASFLIKCLVVYRCLASCFSIYFIPQFFQASRFPCETVWRHNWRHNKLVVLFIYIHIFVVLRVSDPLSNDAGLLRHHLLQFKLLLLLIHLSLHLVRHVFQLLNSQCLSREFITLQTEFWNLVIKRHAWHCRNALGSGRAENFCTEPACQSEGTISVHPKILFMFLKLSFVFYQIFVVFNLVVLVDGCLQVRFFIVFGYGIGKHTLIQDDRPGFHAIFVLKHPGLVLNIVLSLFTLIYRWMGIQLNSLFFQFYETFWSFFWKMRGLIYESVTIPWVWLVSVLGQWCSFSFWLWEFF